MGTSELKFPTLRSQDPNAYSHASDCNLLSYGVGMASEVSAQLSQYKSIHPRIVWTSGGRRPWAVQCRTKDKAPQISNGVILWICMHPLSLFWVL